MIIRCNKCGSDLEVHNNISQKIKCPRCQNIIEIYDSKGHTPSSGDQIDPKLMNFIKEEIEKMKFEITGIAEKGKIADMNHPRENKIRSENKKCLICMDNSLISKKIHESLAQHHYDLADAATLAEASLLISNSKYNLIVIDENLSADNEAGTKLLRILNFVPSERRRSTFSVLLSSTCKTRDSYNAFIHGANLVINKNDVDKFINIIADEMDNHHKMYELIQEIIEQQE